MAAAPLARTGCHRGDAGTNGDEQHGAAGQDVLPVVLVSRIANFSDSRTQAKMRLVCRAWATEVSQVVLSVKPGRGLSLRGLTSLQQAFPNLQSLDLRDCPLLEADHLATLQKFRRLQILRLGHIKEHPYQVDNAWMVHVAAAPSISTLQLCNCPGVCDTGMHNIGALTGLTALELGHCNLSDEGLLQLRGLQQLQKLSLAYCKRITDQGLQALLPDLPSLRFVNLRKCKLVTAKGISPSITSASSLAVIW